MNCCFKTTTAVAHWITFIVKKNKLIIKALNETLVFNKGASNLLVLITFKCFTEFPNLQAPLSYTNQHLGSKFPLRQLQMLYDSS